MFPWKIVRKTYTPADKKLEEIKNILFPPLETRIEPSENSTLKYHVDYSVDSNLDAALMDLKDGNNDEIAQKTIDNAITKLHKVRRLLEAYAQLDKDAKYIIVEDDKENREIIASDE
jgi:DNA-binding transcriptional regulator GbsR (MarR family)